MLQSLEIYKYVKFAGQRYIIPTPSSLKGTKEQKKEYTQSLLRMLWAGNVQEAVSYLKGLDGSRIKSSHWLGELTGYAEWRY
jgi:hypothetical protein